MYFKTESTEYRTKGNGWQQRELGKSSWVDAPKNMWNSIYELRKTVFRNRRPKMADNVRIRLNKTYNEQTKKTTGWAYKYGVDLDSLVTK